MCIFWHHLGICGQTLFYPILGKSLSYQTYKKLHIKDCTGKDNLKLYIQLTWTDFCRKGVACWQIRNEIIIDNNVTVHFCAEYLCKCSTTRNNQSFLGLGCQPRTDTNQQQQQHGSPRSVHACAEGKKKSFLLYGCQQRKQDSRVFLIDQYSAHTLWGRGAFSSSLCQCQCFVTLGERGKINSSTREMTREADLKALKFHCVLLLCCSPVCSSIFQKREEEKRGYLLWGKWFSGASREANTSIKDNSVGFSGSSVAARLALVDHRSDMTNDSQSNGAFSEVFMTRDG